MQSVTNALRVLEEVALRQPIGVGELSRRLGMPKTSVQRALVTLHDAGWLRPGGTELRRWYLTGKALSVGRHSSPELGLREAALPTMNRLRDQTGETIHLSVRDGDGMFLVERVDSPNAVRTFNPLGANAPLHASASGKAVLALLPDTELERLLEVGLERYTPATTVAPGELRAELAAIRERGYAVNFGEWRADVTGVGRAIADVDGQPYAAVNVSAPASRTSEEDINRYGKLVINAAMEIEARLNSG